MRPEKSEYNEFYYTYIQLVEGKDILTFLLKQKQEFIDLLSGLDEEMGLFQYDEGKWTVKQVIGHSLDTERVMAYRALAIARGDKTPLPGFDQDEYMLSADFNSLSFDALLHSFSSLRDSNIALFKTLTTSQLLEMGTSSGFPVSARAMVCIVAGHLEHHKNVLLNKYLK